MARASSVSQTLPMFFDLGVRYATAGVPLSCDLLEDRRRIARVPHARKLTDRVNALPWREL